MQLEQLILTIRSYISEHDAEMMHHFEDHASMARDAKRILKDDLEQLGPGDEILDGGALLPLFAYHLTSEGLPITVLRPVGTPSPDRHRLQTLTHAAAKRLGLTLNFSDLTLQTLGTRRRFRLAYIFNMSEQFSKDEHRQAWDLIHAAMTTNGRFAMFG